jgi:hypothetical protein
MDRLDVIHVIGVVVTELVWAAVHDSVEFDAGAYAAALAELAPPG